MVERFFIVALIITALVPPSISTARPEVPVAAPSHSVTDSKSSNNRARTETLSWKEILDAGLSRLKSLPSTQTKEAIALGESLLKEMGKRPEAVPSGSYGFGVLIADLGPGDRRLLIQLMRDAVSEFEKENAKPKAQLVRSLLESEVVKVCEKKEAVDRRSEKETAFMFDTSYDGGENLARIIKKSLRRVPLDDQGKEKLPPSSLVAKHDGAKNKWQIHPVSAEGKLLPPLKSGVQTEGVPGDLLHLTSHNLFTPNGTGLETEFRDSGQPDLTTFNNGTTQNLNSTARIYPLGQSFQKRDRGSLEPLIPTTAIEPGDIEEFLRIGGDAEGRTPRPLDYVWIDPGSNEFIAVDESKGVTYQQVTDPKSGQSSLKRNQILDPHPFVANGTQTSGKHIIHHRLAPVQSGFDNAISEIKVARAWIVQDESGAIRRLHEPWPGQPAHLASLFKAPTIHGTREEKTPEPRPVIRAKISDFHGDPTQFIDSEMEKIWKAGKVRPSQRATDEEFIRRASLDLLGRLPTEKESKRFLKLPEHSRRNDLCDALADSEDFADYWARRWERWLMETPTQVEINRNYAFISWLKGEFQRGDFELSDIVKKLVDAPTAFNGPSNLEASAARSFINRHEGTRQDKAHLRAHYGEFRAENLTDRVSEVFLGVRVQCAQCHDRFEDSRLKQNRYWELNAFFRDFTNNNGYGGPPTPISGNNPRGFIYYLNRKGVGIPVSPRFLDGNAPNGSELSKRRALLAQYITEDASFDRAMVNRMWNEMFGRGLNVGEEIDDLIEGTEFLSDNLINGLAKHFRQANHKPRELMRWMCKTKAYGRTSVHEWSKGKRVESGVWEKIRKYQDLLKAFKAQAAHRGIKVEAIDNLADKPKVEDNLFQYSTVKKLNEEQFINSLIQALGQPLNEANRVDWRGELLYNSDPNSGDRSEKKEMDVALAMLNSVKLNQAVQAAFGAEGSSDPKELAWEASRGSYNRLYQTILRRHATEDELKTISEWHAKALSNGTPAKEVAALKVDIAMALLNSSEFGSNH